MEHTDGAQIRAGLASSGEHPFVAVNMALYVSVFYLRNIILTNCFYRARLLPYCTLST